MVSSIQEIIFSNTQGAVHHGINRRELQHTCAHAHTPQMKGSHTCL
jgi:hypothetical protein